MKFDLDYLVFIITTKSKTVTDTKIQLITQHQPSFSQHSRVISEKTG